MLDYLDPIGQWAWRHKRLNTVFQIFVRWGPASHCWAGIGMTLCCGVPMKEAGRTYDHTMPIGPQYLRGKKASSELSSGQNNCHEGW